MDAALGGFVLFERIEGDAVEHREVLRGMAGAFAIQVLAEADIEHPMQFVLDAPVLANGCIQPLRIGPQAGDVVADFALCFAGGRIDGWWGVSHRLAMQRESTGALVLNLSAIHAMQPHRTG